MSCLRITFEPKIKTLTARLYLKHLQCSPSLCIICCFNRKIQSLLTLCAISFLMTLTKKMHHFLHKCKVHRRTGHESSDEQGYSSTVSLISTLHGDGWSTPRSGRFIPGKLDNPRIGGWVGPGAGMDRCGKSRTHRGSISGQSSP
jgi:hypothetical protein